MTKLTMIMIHPAVSLSPKTNPIQIKEAIRSIAMNLITDQMNLIDTICKVDFKRGQTVIHLCLF